MRSALTVSASALVVMMALAGEGEWGPRVAAQAPSEEKPSILVNPQANGNGNARTIQEAIDRVSPGGQVLVLPGTYAETLAITKGLTLAGIGGLSGDVIISPTGTPASVIEIATSEPVTLKGLTVHVPA
jgi:pectin methylesterase-like acyl-CoA thioesterase